MRRNLCRTLYSVCQPRPAAARLAGSLSNQLARQRASLLSTRAEHSDRGPDSPSRGFRIRGRALGAMAFIRRIPGGLGLARRNDAALRTHYLSLVPPLG